MVELKRVPDVRLSKAYLLNLCKSDCAHCEEARAIERLSRLNIL